MTIITYGNARKPFITKTRLDHGKVFILRLVIVQNVYFLLWNLMWRQQKNTRSRNVTSWKVKFSTGGADFWTYRSYVPICQRKWFEGPFKKSEELPLQGRRQGGTFSVKGQDGVSDPGDPSAGCVGVCVRGLVLRSPPACAVKHPSPLRFHHPYHSPIRHSPGKLWWLEYSYY